MSQTDIYTPRGWHSRGYLPHFDGGELSQFITYRLSDSLPQTVLQRWRHEFEQEGLADIDSAVRKRAENYLDKGYGECHLKTPRVAAMVEENLLYFDSVRYRLFAWVVMPNHIHILITPCLGHSLTEIMRTKSYTAREANRILNRKGQFWQEDYFDRYIRDAEHFDNVVAYIENNPVKARLCNKPSNWRFSSAWWKKQSA
jgi:putative DNA methylase